MKSLLEWAHEYAALGWRVIPVAKGGKHPSLAGWGDLATTNPDCVESWWGPGGAYEGNGIGVVLGAESGIWAIDIESPDACVLRFDDRVAASVTPSGGRHYIFPWPDNDQGPVGLETLGPGVESHGEGRLLVLPPTVVPSGQYEWASEFEVPA